MKTLTKNIYKTAVHLLSFFIEINFYVIREKNTYWS